MRHFISSRLSLERSNNIRDNRPPFFGAPCRPGGLQCVMPLLSVFSFFMWPILYQVRCQSDLAGLALPGCLCHHAILQSSLESLRIVEGFGKDGGCVALNLNKTLLKRSFSARAGRTLRFQSQTCARRDQTPCRLRFVRQLYSKILLGDGS